jgi:hypothetical protein
VADSFCCCLDFLQEIQTLQSQLDQHREQLSNSEATRMEIEAVREYRRTRQQQQQLDTQLKQLMQQAGQVCSWVLVGWITGLGWSGSRF